MVYVTGPSYTSTVYKPIFALWFPQHYLKKRTWWYSLFSVMRFPGFVRNHFLGFFENEKKTQAHFESHRSTILLKLFRYLIPNTNQISDWFEPHNTGNETIISVHPTNLFPHPPLCDCFRDSCVWKRRDFLLGNLCRILLLSRVMRLHHETHELRHIQLSLAAWLAWPFSWPWVRVLARCACAAADHLDTFDCGVVLTIITVRTFQDYLGGRKRRQFKFLVTGWTRLFMRFFSRSSGRWWLIHYNRQFNMVSFI